MKHKSSISAGKKITIVVIAFAIIAALAFPFRRSIYHFIKDIVKHTKSVSYTGGKYVWGIDISHHQRNIDWNKVAKYNKPDFVFIKCTEGKTHRDDKYALYKKQAERKGIVTGAYHFFSYHTPGREQAINFIKHAALKKGDLFPVLDIEYKRNRPSNAEIRRQVKEFCKVIKKHYGVNPIIYCECAYYKNILKRDFKDFNYWISSLGSKPHCNYVFWQYTDKGNVKGIGRIDKNRLNQKRKLSDFILKN